MGTIYLRGKTWWIQYYKDGRPYRESSRSEKKTVAKRLLDKREGAIAEGKEPGVRFDRVKFDELKEDLLRDYRVNKKKSLDRAERSVEHLKEYFEGVRAPHINTAKIQEYIEKRINEEATSATINRELAALKRMFNLGAQCTPPKVDKVPYIPMLKENNVRKGFFEHGEFVALRDALPDYLKGFITFAYKTGWRVSEIRNLTWEQVDFKNGTVSLDAGTTKNDEPRTVYLDDELMGVFREQWERRKRAKAIHPYVFLNKSGTGKIKDFRGAWQQACKKAGIGQRLFHDFRRTAVRNMVRAGVPERVAMMISGHKTRSVFERYNIVDEADLKNAAQRQQEYLSSQTTTKTVTVADFGHKKGS
jgi:integrase